MVNTMFAVHHRLPQTWINRISLFVTEKDAIAFLDAKRSEGFICSLKRYTEDIEYPTGVI